jgi:hypothetical protein
MDRSLWQAWSSIHVMDRISHLFNITDTSIIPAAKPIRDTRDKRFKPLMTRVLTRSLCL